MSEPDKTIPAIDGRRDIEISLRVTQYPVLNWPSRLGCVFIMSLISPLRRSEHLVPNRVACICVFFENTPIRPK